MEKFFLVEKKEYFIKKNKPTRLKILKLLKKIKFLFLFTKMDDQLKKKTIVLILIMNWSISNRLIMKMSTI